MDESRVQGPAAPAGATSQGPRLADEVWIPADEVRVSFSSDDFELAVRWPTSASSDDATRVGAAAEWFDGQYGFNPSQHVTHCSVRHRRTIVRSNSAS